MELSDAVEMIMFCPRMIVDENDEGCQLCPLKEMDIEGIAACDHIRAAGLIIGDPSFT